jgi:hypothetical protein
MKAKFLMVVAAVSSLSAWAQQQPAPHGKALQDAAARLTGTINAQASVSSMPQAPHAMTSQAAGMPALPGYLERQHSMIPIQIKVDTARSSGQFRTNYGVCNFKYFVGEVGNLGPIIVQCDGPDGDGSGSWLLQADGSILVHIKTRMNEYNLKL